jgi:hypothetical protein
MDRLATARQTAGETVHVRHLLDSEHARETLSGVRIALSRRLRRLQVEKTTRYFAELRFLKRGICMTTHDKFSSGWRVFLRIVQKWDAQ